MDAKRLLYFCTIVEQGQISRAARVLNISQPPLSQRLKELEDELGVQLIIREGHTWQVTDPGRVLYERSRLVLDNLAEIPAEVKNAAGGFSGTVAIGASTICLSRYLRAVPTLAARFPKLECHLFINDSSSLERHIQSRDLDFAILLLPTKEEVYTVQHLPKDHFSVVFRPGAAPVPGPGGVGVEQLQDVPLLIPRRWDGSGSYQNVLKAFHRAGSKPKVLLTSPDVRMLLDCLEAGMGGAALLPDQEIPARIRAAYPVLPLHMPGMSVQPALIHLRDRYLSPAARAVIATILAME